MDKLELESGAFPHEGDIPDLYTCRGENISPPLVFRNAPAETGSFALLMADLDTPVGTITHWVAYNIPPDFGGLIQGLPAGRLLEDGVCQGRNGMFRFGYMGPCPPWGRHRYLFRLFAVDVTLQPKGTVSKRKLLHLIGPHILAESRLLGYYPSKEVRQ